MRASSRLPSPVVAGGFGDLVGEVGHLLAGLEVALGVDPVDVPGVENDQPAGGIEHVGHRRVGVVEVTHGVGQHRLDTLLLGKPAIRAATASEPGPRWWTTSISRLSRGTSRTARPTTARAARSNRRAATRATDLGLGAEQDEQVLGVVSDQLVGC